jgi:2,4-dienoyl-CoA reductase-like NADH-dependent reductase (Old Yellow Enzyme family)
VNHPALEPGRLGPLVLRNRFLKTATYEGMTPGGCVSDALVAFHAAQAAAGVAMTTVAYGAVADSGRTFADQLLVDEGSRAGLETLTSAVHAAGGKASLQLAHCGGFSKHHAPAGPSAGVNAYGLAYGRPWIRAMTEHDIAGVVDAFGTATAHARDAGFDAVEVHCGHGYLLSQFLSPALNRRTDAWGGTLPNRLRLPVAVMERVRSVAPGMAVLAKINLEDGVSGGSTPDDAVVIARALVAAGADALVTSGGLVQRSAFFLMRGGVPIRGMVQAESSRVQRLAMRAFAPFLVRGWPYEPGFFLKDGRPVVRAVDTPVVALGGIDSSEVVRAALDAGYRFVAMGRALLADPDFIRRLEAGEEVVSRCTHCNDCVAEMDRGGVRCTL